MTHQAAACSAVGTFFLSQVLLENILQALEQIQ